MYKVLIAEDEASTRRWLSKIINWTALGFELVEVARHGIEAWELLQEHTDIDLVITDIRMPEMDGIELVKRIRSHSSNRSEIVILSGYGEFKYAQEALRYQVNDYILKPITKEQLTELLLNIVIRLEKRKLMSNNLLYATQQRKENEEREKQAFFVRWLTGNSNGPVRLKEWKKYGIPYEEDGMLLYVAEVDGYDQLATAMSEKDRSLSRFMIQNILNEVASRSGISQCIVLATNQFIVMIHTRDGMDTYGMKQIGQSFQESLKRYIRLFPVQLSIGCVRVCGSWEAIPEFYAQASTALAYKFFEGKESIHIYDPSMIRTQDIPYPVQREKEILNALKQHQYEQGKQLLNTMLKELYDEGSIPSIRFIASEMLIQLLKELRDIKSLPVMREVMESLCQEVRCAETFEDMTHKLCELIDFILNTIQLESKTMGPVTKGMEYMKLKLNRDISLLEVAEYVGVSPTYYSTLFRQESGYRFVDYLTRLRMEKGMELLEKTDKTIAIIGEEIGYSNYRYFIKVFKDYYGMTPSQYRGKIKDPSANIS
ncbi:response regulator [Paenibacillus thiaminolyticus]|uniref:response regulator n=1 Tax=Paenibacillus thiaminolyticus TaxID=49283 RepID=UPI0035A70C6B